MLFPLCLLHLPQHHLLIITLFPCASLFGFHVFSCLSALSSLLVSALDPPPTPLCCIITMNPKGPTSARCICPTRGASEEATTVSSRRRGCSQTGLKPSTSTFTSQTGNPLLSVQTAQTLYFQLDLKLPEAIFKSTQYVDIFQLIQTHEKAETGHPTVVHVGQLYQQLGRMMMVMMITIIIITSYYEHTMFHPIIKSKCQNNPPNYRATVISQSQAASPVLSHRQTLQPLQNTEGSSLLAVDYYALSNQICKVWTTLTVPPIFFSRNIIVRVPLSLCSMF